jgi:hypothetical protein
MSWAVSGLPFQMSGLLFKVILGFLGFQILKASWRSLSQVEHVILVVRLADRIYHRAAA